MSTAKAYSACNTGQVSHVSRHCVQTVGEKPYGLQYWQIEPMFEVAHNAKNACICTLSYVYKEESVAPHVVY